MTTGAAYKPGAGPRPARQPERPLHEAASFQAIVLATVAAMALDVPGFNPMRAPGWSGVVQGFPVPPLLFMMLPGPATARRWATA